MNEKRPIRPRVALIDWDGTVRSGFVIDPWCKHLVDRGLVAGEVLGLLRNAFVDYARSKLSHDELVTETATIYANGIKYLSLPKLERCAQDFVDGPCGELFTFAPKLFELLHLQGVQNIVVSGAPTEVLKAYARKYPIDLIFGLDVSWGRDGLILVNHGLSNEKKRVAESLNQRFDVALGLGNSASDGPILSVSAVPILVNGSPDELPSGLKERVISCTDQSVLAELEQRLTQMACRTDIEGPQT